MDKKTKWDLSGALVLDSQSRYRYSYSLSPYVFQVSQGIALDPPNLGLKLPPGHNRAKVATCNYSIANRGLMTH